MFPASMKPQTPGNATQRRPSWPIAALAVLAITFVEARELRLMHGRFEHAFAEHCRAIAEGHAQWTVYQNRVAGPFLVQFLSGSTGMPFDDAYRLVLQGLWLLSNGCAFVVGRRLNGGSAGAWTLVLANALLFVAIQHDYIYIWDYIDATTMLLFAYGAFRGAGLRLFIPLFFIELLNREAASFIALWIMLDAANDLLLRAGPVRWPRAGLRLALGAILGAGGVWWTHFIRGRLLRYHPPDFSELVLGQQKQWPYNLMTLRQPLQALMMIGGLAYGYFRAARTLGERKVIIALLLAAMIGSTFAFSRVDETRVWVAFIPFLMLFWSLPKRDCGKPSLTPAVCGIGSV
jgi:hypothetical protein